MLPISGAYSCLGLPQEQCNRQRHEIMKTEGIWLELRHLQPPKRKALLSRR
jgi:hypothetical protein